MSSATAAQPCATNTLNTTPSDFNYHPVRSESFKEITGAFLAKEVAGISPAAFVSGALQHLSGGNGASLPVLKAEAPSFTPSMMVIPGRPTLATNTEIPACIFFSNGFCRNGVMCAFRHESLASRHSHDDSGKEEQNILVS
jgi:hypothetical protein